ncbi:TetR/AcrR family transcriptional regulator [Brevibacillus brevis]|uniref:TetR/AcrR family transcriptional regulator n=1 Tax=Brevibacillus brevis TaxID=1393 RepID=A0A517I9Q2_BREBE|nr:TetR/AcrR family transcriptional regulator [Brevibacillus brevis]QDS35614.1 TetR/AcrR family transcriptional regulator [Brevibacillus brevis]
MRQRKKEQILDVASSLFYKQGITATGVDQVVAESGVAKMTLYNNFPTKEHLVIAYLETRDSLWRNWFETTVYKKEVTPSERLVALFDTLEEWFLQPDFRGCSFINTAAEFNEPTHSFHQVSLRHKSLLKNFIKKLVQEAGVREEEELTNALYLLIEGSIVTAMIEGNHEAVHHARRTAQKLVSIFLNEAASGVEEGIH